MSSSWPTSPRSHTPHTSHNPNLQNLKQDTFFQSPRLTWIHDDKIKILLHHRTRVASNPLVSCFVLFCFVLPFFPGDLCHHIWRCCRACWYWSSLSTSSSCTTWSAAGSPAAAAAPAPPSSRGLLPNRGAPWRPPSGARRPCSSSTCRSVSFFSLSLHVSEGSCFGFLIWSSILGSYGSVCWNWWLHPEGLRGPGDAQPDAGGRRRGRRPCRCRGRRRRKGARHFPRLGQFRYHY